MNRNQIKHLGLLARLNITEDEAAVLFNDFKKIVDYISRLNKVKVKIKTKQLAPNEHFNIFRDDDGKCLSNETQEDILNQAPKRKGNYFVVKKII